MTIDRDARYVVETVASGPLTIVQKVVANVFDPLGFKHEEKIGEDEGDINVFIYADDAQGIERVLAGIDRIDRIYGDEAVYDRREKRMVAYSRDEIKDALC